MAGSGMMGPWVDGFKLNEMYVRRAGAAHRAMDGPLPMAAWKTFKPENRLRSQSPSVCPGQPLKCVVSNLSIYNMGTTVQEGTSQGCHEDKWMDVKEFGKGPALFSEGGIFPPAIPSHYIHGKTSVPRAKQVQEIKPNANLEGCGWNSQR